MESAVDFVTDIARDQLGESFYKGWIPFIGTLFFFIFGCNWAGAIIPWKLIELPEGELYPEVTGKAKVTIQPCWSFNSLKNPLNIRNIKY